MAERKDYYAILGVARDAAPRDVKLAYRKGAQQYHPDKAAAGGMTKEQAESKFTDIAEAYEAGQACIYDILFAVQERDMAASAKLSCGHFMQQAKPLSATAGKFAVSLLSHKQNLCTLLLLCIQLMLAGCFDIGPSSAVLSILDLMLLPLITLMC